MVKWFLDGDRLGVSQGDQARFPSAEEIWRAAFKGEGELAQAVKDAPVTFSRYPVEVRLSSEIRDGQLQLIAQARAAEDWFTIAGGSRRESDHVVHEGRWYPLVREGLERIRSVLSEYGLDDTPAPVGLTEFLNLSKAARSAPDLVTLVDEVPLNLLAPSDGSDLLSSFRGSLYPYQEEGRRWLNFILEHRLGGILGDEMGLGKTVQVIAGLQSGRFENSYTPVLIACPGTLIENWRRELRRFWPSCKIYTHRGADRLAFPSDISGFDVVLTSYDTMRRDAPVLEMIEWRTVVLDEAQAIKNPHAKRTRAVKRIPRGAAIAMTGTPLENHLLDLWSITDFVLPGYLGSRRDFESRYDDSPAGAAELRPHVTPVLMRRHISEVARDLPERIEVPEALELSPGAADEYEQIRVEIGGQGGGTAVLGMLTKLRQYCSHPFLISGMHGDPAASSVKYRRLVEILEEILASDEKALIFSSYVGMLKIFENDLSRRFSVYAGRLDGSVPQTERQQVVDSFTQVAGGAMLAINPSVGGSGLNITAANHVIHYTPEWNPAVQDQASARAYRRGQELPVTIHRPYYVQTVEDVIEQRLARKRRMFEEAVPAESGISDAEDLVVALAISPLTDESGGES